MPAAIVMETRNHQSSVMHFLCLTSLFAVVYYRAHQPPRTRLSSPMEEAHSCSQSAVSSLDIQHLFVLDCDGFEIRTPDFDANRTDIISRLHSVDTRDYYPS